MKIKPSPGVVIRDPVTKLLLPADVETEVPDNDLFWQRRINDGDVIVRAEKIKAKRSADQ